MERFLQQYGGFLGVAIALAVGILTGWRNGVDLAGVMFIGLLLSEIGKKDSFYTRFRDAMPVHRLEHQWLGAAAEGTAPGMRNVRFACDSQDPFILLVGFRLKLPFGIDWFHPYGCIESDEHGVVFVQTWMGNGECRFLYHCSRPNATIQISHEDRFQSSDLKPKYIHWPHFWQQPPFNLFG